MNSMTPTTRWNRRPFSRDLTSQFNDFLKSFESDFFGDDRSLVNKGDAELWSDFAPAVDIEEGKGVYMITADLPGMKADDIKIDVTNRTLRLSGARKRETKDEGNNYYERSYGRFLRTFTLPETVDSKKIEAHFEDGVLRVVLPKSQVELSQEVKIQSGKPQGWLERFTLGKKEPSEAKKEVKVETSGAEENKPRPN